MSDTSGFGFTLEEMIAGKVTDGEGKEAPKEVTDAFKKAGIKCFYCNNLKFRWGLIGRDAKSLFDQLNG